MADRDFSRPLATMGRNRIQVNFSFYTNGTSNPNTRLFQGNADFVSTILQVGTGAYQVTASARDFYNLVVGAKATMEDSGAGTQQEATIGGFQNEGTSSPLKFNVYTYAYPNNVSNITNTRVWVELILRNTASVGAGDP